MKLKFVSKTFFIEIEPSNGDTFKIITNEGIEIPKIISRKYLLKHFGPVSCGALNFIDPDRDARITGEL